MAKISTFIIMMVVFSVLIAGWIIPLIDYGEAQYGIDDYNTSSLSGYNKLSELDDQTKDIKDKTLDLQSRSGVLDVVGGFFEAGYDATKVAFSSFGTFFSLSTKFVSDIGLYNANIYLWGLVTVVLVILTFIIISTVVKNRI